MSEVSSLRDSSKLSRLLPFDSDNDLHLEESFTDTKSVQKRSGTFQPAQSMADIAIENLAEQVRELNDVNARLMCCVVEKNNELKKLKEAQANSVVTAANELDATGTKIVELAKAKRDLTAKYEAERTKVQKLVSEKKELEQRLSHLEEKLKPFENTEVVEHQKVQPAISTGSLDLNRRRQTALEKCSVASQEAVILKQQNVKLLRLLERELGSNVDVSRLLREETPTFRGRDEQIQLLKGKVEALKRELAALKYLERDIPNSDPATSSRNYGDCVSVCRSNEYNAKYREELSAADQKRREMHSELSEKYTALQRAHAEAKTKLTSEKARNEYLSKENFRLTQFNKHVVDTCQKDAELIQYFQSTITELRSAVTETSLLSLPLIPPVHKKTEDRRRNAGLQEEISNMEKQMQELKQINSTCIAPGQSSRTTSDQIKKAAHLADIVSKGHSSDTASNDSLIESPKRQISLRKYGDPDLFRSFRTLLECCKEYASCLAESLEKAELRLQMTTENVYIQKEESSVVQLQIRHYQQKLEERDLRNSSGNRHYRKLRPAAKAT